MLILCYCFLGTIGHVAHGKSTVVKAISGVQVGETLFVHLSAFEHQLIGVKCCYCIYIYF